MQKITPFLWFDNQAEEAMNFYVKLFKRSVIMNISRYGPGGQLPEGTLFTGSFQLDGQEYMVLNGGPVFTFNEAISLFVTCESQAEVDELWQKLTEGGQEGQCGWLKDKYGVSWQIVPSDLGKYLGGSDSEGAGRAMQAMLKMKKLDVGLLKQAYDGA
jgi:predicted 3-demethylubiquinone-9 3-methyltransferase (glyoxalase superfamily)